MKIRFFALGIAILVCATVLATGGAYLKYQVLKPLDLYQDKSVFELPFLMYGDDYLRFMVEHADELKQMEIQGTIPPEHPTPGSSKPNPTNPSGDHSSNATTSGSQESTDHSTVPTDPSTDSIPNDSSAATNITDTSLGQDSSTATTSPTSTTSSSQTTSPPTTSSTAPTTTPSTSSGSSTTGPNFDFSSGVGDVWFENTLFIGDSRVVGLREYARSGNAEYFCDVGMSLLNYGDKYLADKNFPSQTLASLLESNQYDKIIVNFGLNECGYSDYSFQLMYSNFVSMLRQSQPNATIILQGIMSVSKNKADTAYYFEPDYIAARSAFIASLADGEHIFYIDCNEYFSDENGYLYSSLTNDGYHPSVSGYRYWRDWIAFALEEIGL